MSDLPGDPPYGALVVVHRWRDQHPEFWLLRRGSFGPGFAGEWAWGPPDGTRDDGETIEQCAARVVLGEKEDL